MALCSPLNHTGSQGEMSVERKVSVAPDHWAELGEDASIDDDAPLLLRNPLQTCGPQHRPCTRGSERSELFSGLHENGRSNLGYFEFGRDPSNQLMLKL
jgi:hypothetical protein